jgi:hypothetical protein
MRSWLAAKTLALVERLLSPFVLNSCYFLSLVLKFPVKVLMIKGKHHDQEIESSCSFSLIALTHDRRKR